MVHVLVSLTAAAAVDGSARQVEGVLRCLPESSQTVSAGAAGAGAAGGQPFSGWLELLGHLERLITPAAQVAEPVDAGVTPAAAHPAPPTPRPGES